MKQRKILEINEGKWHLVCIKTDEKRNPYKLYRIWHDTRQHRKLIVRYCDFQSIMWAVHQIINLGYDYESFKNFI